MPSCKARTRLVKIMTGVKRDRDTPKGLGKATKSTSKDKNNNDITSSSSKSSDISKKSKNYEKYSLRPRSIQNRIETEKRQKQEPKKQPKPKQKPPPLSKYRRKTANARERSRMREINTAFDSLQSVVPAYPVLPVNAQGKTCEKLTKITTLRLAMNYIQALGNLLDNPGDADLDQSMQVSCTPASSSSIMNCSGSSSSSSSVYSESSTGSVTGGSLGSISEFSPASSYAMSPISSCSPAGPDCIQTVMRSVVSPAAAAALSANAVNLSNLTLNGQSLMASMSLSSLGQNIVLAPISASNPGVRMMTSPKLPPQHSSPVSMSPPPTSSPSNAAYSSYSPYSISHSTMLPNNQSTIQYSPKLNLNKLPPISTSLSSALLRKSMSTFAADCVQLTANCYSGNNSFNFGGGNTSGGTRTGSLSSLTESDLSEYASDLLSDEGSTLDDPMFEDIIGVGVATDLDLLLQADGETLSFS